MMLHIELPIVLASASPRRAKLLRQIGLEFRIYPPQIEEPFMEELEKKPGSIATILAKKKAKNIATKISGSLIIGADTIVSYQSTMLGKPRDKQHAFDMLSTLSGQPHTVTTGVALLHQGYDQILTFFEETQVRFRNLDDEEIKRYIATGEPMDKAGAYGIQGLGTLLVQQIKGDYNNVVGFPLTRFYQEVKNLANKKYFFSK